MNSLFTPPTPQGTNYPSPHDNGRAGSSVVGTSSVGLCGMSDTELERHIQDCGWLMEDAMRRWCETGDFGYRGEASRWKLLMEEAIKSRSPEQVARMERERGLA
jgi:predicted RNA-binding Zn ribbon-like protein